MDRKDMQNYFYKDNINEQFYKIIQPTAILLKIWGFFPFKNSPIGEKKHLKFEFKNTVFIAKLCIYVFSTAALYSLIDGRIQKFTLIYLSLTVLTLIFICHFTDKKLLETLNKLENYDNDLRLCANKVVCKRFQYRGFIWFIFNLLGNFLPIHLVPIYLRIMRYNQSNCGSCILIAVVINEGPWHILFCGLYILICFELSLRFTELNTDVTAIMSNLDTHNVDILLENNRLLHGKLCDITELFNSSFGPRLNIYFLKLISLFLIEVHSYIYVNIPVTWTTVFINIYKFIVAFIICYCSDLMFLQVSDSFTFTYLEITNELW